MYSFMITRTKVRSTPRTAGPGSLAILCLDVLEVPHNMSIQRIWGHNTAETLNPKFEIAVSIFLSIPSFLAS